MSNLPLSKKIAIGVVVLIIIIVLLFVMKKPSSVSAPVDTAATEVATTSQPVVTTPSVPVDPTVEQVKNSGVSDTALNQDIAALDSQLSGFSTDTKNASATTTK